MRKREFIFEIINIINRMAPMFAALMTLHLISKLDCIDTTNKAYMVLIFCFLYMYWTFNFYGDRK